MKFNSMPKEKPYDCLAIQLTLKQPSELHQEIFFNCESSRSVFLNRRAAAGYRALESITSGRENLSF